MTHGTSHAPEQPSLVTAYAEANQECRDIAQRVGIQHCDDDADWKAAERRAEDLYDKAIAAGHTPEELSAANKARKARAVSPSCG